MSEKTMMAREARETAAGARRQIATCGSAIAALGRRLRAQPPPFVATCARGSSDHAATYGKYLIETTVGRAVASIGPSVASAYHGPLHLAGALFVAVSQSGRSPDLLRLTEAARAGGAIVVGMVNDEASPLAALCELVLPLCAGEERAIAATKSCVLAQLAFLQLVAAWTAEPALHDAVARAPDALDAASQLDWSAALAPLATATSVYVLGRGIGLGTAHEVALKLKETCRLHAEAFSTAEVLHGPLALVGRGLPVLALGQPDDTATAFADTLARLRELGADVRSTLDTLPVIACASVLAPLCQLQSFYLAVPELARARGLDADAPLHLHKVTETV